MKKACQLAYVCYKTCPALLNNCAVFVLTAGSMFLFNNFSILGPDSFDPKGAHYGFVSSEVHFADISESGLSIVPASCPSSPDYAGECDNPPLPPTPSGCALTANLFSINEGQSTTLIWSSNVSGGYGHYIGASAEQTPPGAVPANGSLTVSPTVNTTYVMSVAFNDTVCSKEGCTPTVGYRYCDATITVNPTNPVPCNTPAMRSADNKGYTILAGQTERRIDHNGGIYCVSNSSANNYFIPANTVTETQSFLNKASSLPGVTVHQ